MHVSILLFPGNDFRQDDLISLSVLLCAMDLPRDPGVYVTEIVCMSLGILSTEWSCSGLGALKRLEKALKHIWAVFIPVDNLMTYNGLNTGRETSKSEIELEWRSILYRCCPNKMKALLYVLVEKAFVLMMRLATTWSIWEPLFSTTSFYSKVRQAQTGRIIHQHLSLSIKYQLGCTTTFGHLSNRLFSNSSYIFNKICLSQLQVQTPSPCYLILACYALFKTVVHHADM